ncbi:unnamed protein product [Arabidopsis lyrata]|nr:unnamed protein product [Arabidopsis lyrata]
MSLESIKYPGGDEFVNRLISSCPILEDLVVKRCENDNVTIFNIVVPSLKSLVLHESWDKFVAEAHGFLLDAPSLELLEVFDNTCRILVVTSNMPKIVEAKDVGGIFCCLVHLKMCTCEPEWLELLMHVLKKSPKLRALKFEKCPGQGVVPCSPWMEPSSVPDCLLSSLETVEWVMYKGTEEENEVVALILRSGSCLRKVTIHPISTSNSKKLRMIKELSLSPRRSPTCQLAFD